MASQPPAAAMADAHSEEGHATSSASPKPQELFDHAAALPSSQRQSLGTNPEIALDATMLPPAQRPGASVTATPLGKAAVTRSLKGKEKEWTAVAEKKRPLQLLDLPVDILKEIIEKLPHTNDLTSLSLCHSVFHALTIPHIYSRFDIVWPDDTSTSVQRTGVDALTYGLATLVMAEENFGEAQWQRKPQGNKDRNHDATLDPYPIQRRRRGNYYAKYTKKFSLGNGPKEWVQEYLISKEGGKMLGTLVALAVSRMRNLETFVWDMPTGVLRDVWLALSSLADRWDGQESRLEKVWIRWHDNSMLDGPDGTHHPIPPPPPPPNIPPPPNVSSVPVLAAINMTGHPSNILAVDRVEHPTFSVLPALKSLNVLDIDELPYLDEMSILIARSQHKLRELRIGVATQAQQREWSGVWDGDTLQQVDYSTARPVESRLGDKRLGGVLGVLLGRVYNLRHNADTQRHSPSGSRSIRNSVDKTSAPPLFAQPPPPPSIPAEPSLTPSTAAAQAQLLQEANQEADRVETSGVGAGVGAGAGAEVRDDAQPPAAESHESTILQASAQTTPQTPTPSGPWITGRPIPLRSSRRHGPYLNGKLRLETLELERVPLSIPILQKAFDWTMLTRLTLLHCQEHEQLWKMLRRTYSPTSPYNQSSKSSGRVRLEYGLNLKQIHTNAVSPSLITFLKETLAPNSLEVLFLQEARSYQSPVGIEQIFRGPIKRHRASLKKLMIDSGEKGEDGFGSTRWRRWMLSTEVITYITSGRMVALRELGCALDYRDWHHFLQRLPTIAPLRSLYITHIADHPHGVNIDPRDLALQVVDIVTLRPEIELCYMGLGAKCFEILESKPSAPPPLPSSQDPSSANGFDGQGFDGATQGNEGYAPLNEGEVTDEDSDGLDSVEIVVDEENADENAAADNEEEEPSEDEVAEDDWPEDETDDDGDDEYEITREGGRRMRLRLREILFYDDKVAVFRARHGKL